MKKNLKALRRIRDVRELLRDAAAQDVNEAERARGEREHERAHATDQLGEIETGAPDRIRSASRVRDLEVIAMDVSAARIAVGTAAQRARAAGTVVERATERLRGRARELRVAEKLVSELRTELSVESDRREQRMADDLSGARAFDGRGS